MFDKGRDAHTRSNSESKFWMRRGMAKVAMQYKMGQGPKDAHGQPLSYAKRMAEGHSASTLQKFIEDKRTAYGFTERQIIAPESKEGRKIYQYDPKLKKVVQVA